VFDQLRAAWALPEPDEVNRARHAVEAVYRDANLRRHLSLRPSRPGFLQWDVHAADAELGRLAPGSLFRAVLSVQDELVAVEGRPPERRFRGEYAWPESGAPLEPRLIAEGLRFAARMLWFLNDRAALGRLLLAGEGDEPGRWQRDGIVAARFSGAASGLVQAIILARFSGDADLERMAKAKLAAAGDVEVRGFGGTFGEAVGREATEYRAWSPVDLSDLVPLARRVRRRTNPARSASAQP
jgi:hypothetical protein